MSVAKYTQHLPPSPTQPKILYEAQIDDHLPYACLLTNMSDSRA